MSKRINSFGWLIVLCLLLLVCAGVVNAERNFVDTSTSPANAPTSAPQLITAIFLPILVGQPEPPDELTLTFELQRGLYTQPIAVELTTNISGAQIRFTLDGTTPTTSYGTIYTSPIYVDHTTTIRAIAHLPSDAAMAPSKQKTHSYIFVDRIAAQGGIPDGYPNEWSDYPAYYDMAGGIVNSPTYGPLIVEALSGFPTVNLTMNRDDMFGPDGIYQNTYGTGREWERPVAIEYFDPATGADFNIDAGIRLHGGDSRAPDKSPKHSFRLYFRSDYGDADLDYGLFDDDLFGSRATDEFDTLVLRARSNFSWLYPNIFEGQRKYALFLRDQWLRDTHLAMGQPAAHGRYVHLYINNLYWGLYNIQERPSAPFLAEYFGGTKDEYDAINGGEAVDGDLNAWNAMYDIAANGVVDASAYNAIQQYLDLENLADFIILQHYVGNTDWAGSNWYAGRRRVPGAGFKFFVWDGEQILEHLDETELDRNRIDHPSFVFNQLMANSEFRMLFADRIYKHFFNGGALTAPESITRLQTLADTMYAPIVAETARWGDYRNSVDPRGGPLKQYTRNDDWQLELDRLLGTYLPQRTGTVYYQYRDKNWYPAIQPPTFSHSGGAVDNGYMLQLANPNNGVGNIWYTTDGSDPRPAYNNGAPNGINGGDAISVPITANMRINARIYNSATGVWTALHSAEFFIPADYSKLLITELMYNPPVSGDYEFVELKNTGTVALDISGVTFTDGIEHTIPAGVTLSPGAFYVIAKDPVSFTSLYGFAPTDASGYLGQLRNSGERVTLSDPQGNIIFDVTYDDAGSWPIAADGGGYSLVSAAPNTNPNPNDAANWRASTHINGSPNTDD